MKQHDNASKQLPSLLGRPQVTIYIYIYVCVCVCVCVEHVLPTSPILILNAHLALSLGIYTLLKFTYSKMKFLNLILFLAPLAQAQDFDISTGSCNASGVCDAVVGKFPVVCKAGQTGAYNGGGTDGRTACSPSGTAHTYTWRFS